MSSPALTRIFVSYSHANDAAVQRLQRDLEQAGATIWIDHESLIPGMPDWEEAVRDGISQASFVVYAASPDARKSPFVRDEINLARSKGRDVIPFWVSGDDWLDCAPLGWGMTQYSDGRGAGYAAGLSKLLRRLGLTASEAPRTIATNAAAARVASIGAASRPAPPPIPPERFPARLASLGFTPYSRDGVEWIVPPVCAVPAGPFRMGSDKARDKDARENELNRRVVDLPAYEIGRFPVTVAEYACFLTATQRTPPKGTYNTLTWEQQLQRLEHPVANVSWYDAYDYAAWLAKRTEHPWRLPTEAVWEKAARSDPRDPHGPLGASSERIYPWGDTFDKARCNTSESGLRATSPVGWYGPADPDSRAGRRSGASPCGAEEMAGNVWEWMATEYTVDYSKSELAGSRDSTVYRCLRGGAWSDDPRGARAAYLGRDLPGVAYNFIGFRLVLASPAPSAGG